MIMFQIYLNIPSESQAHCLVAHADTHPKPAKELALPTLGLTGIMHETLIIKHRFRPKPNMSLLLN
jgi:hypothetical protein